MDKINNKIWYVISLLFYVAAIITFLGGNENSTGAIWLSLGSTFLCVGSINTKKAQENSDAEEKRD